MQSNMQFLPSQSLVTFSPASLSQIQLKSCLMLKDKHTCNVKTHAVPKRKSSSNRRSKRTVVEDSSVRQQQRDEFGLFFELHGMLALVGQQRAHVNGKVHLVRETRQERQHQFVVIGWRDEIRRQPIALAEIVC